MKKIIYISIIAVLTFSSCEKYLDREPIARVTSFGFYKDEANTILATNSLYDPMGWERHFYGLLLGQGDCASDDAEVGGALNGGPQEDLLIDIMHYKTTLNNKQIDYFCRTCYVGIQRCNNLLQETVDVDYNANIYRGQAFFMRGLYYYYLVTNFGPVPLVTKPVGSEDYRMGNRAEGDDDKGTKQVEAIFLQIVADFDSAANILPNRGQYPIKDLGRATNASAWGYLAKTYAFMASYNKIFKDKDKKEYWNKVVDCANKIKTYGGGYGLLDDYHKIYTIEGDNSIENLFEIEYIESSDYAQKSDGTIRTIDLTPRAIFGKSGNFGYGILNPTIDLVKEFDIENLNGTITHWDETKYNFNLSTIPSSYLADIDGYLLKYTNSTAPKLKTDFKDYDPRLDMIAKPGDSLYYTFDKKWYKLKAFKGDCGGFVANLSATGFWTMKTQSSVKEAFQAHGLNQPLLRYADVLLLEAEAQFNLGKNGEALKLVNQIRERARNSKWVTDSTNKAISYNNGMKKVNGTIPKDLTSITMDDIKRERRLELCNESVRFYDLVRWNIANDVLSKRQKDVKGRIPAWKTDISERLPIPSRLISDGNGNVLQNPGY